MSYSIFYRSMFVRLSDGRYIPMIESGDNNVWEANRKRRARSWHQAAFIGKKQYAFTKEEILEGVEDFINRVKSEYVGKIKPDYRGGDGVITYTDKEIEQSFGNYDTLSIYGKNCFTTTAQHVRNFFKKGIERAISFNDTGLRVYWRVKYPDYDYRYPKTEDELFAAIKEGENAGADVWIDFVEPWAVERLWCEKKRETAKARKRIEHTIGYVVTCNDRYLTKASSRHYFLNNNINYAHIYPTLATAEKMQKRIAKMYRSEIIAVEKVNGLWKAIACTA